MDEKWGHITRVLYGYDREIAHTEIQGEKIEKTYSQVIDLKHFSQTNKCKKNKV